MGGISLLKNGYCVWNSYLDIRCHDGAVIGEVRRRRLGLVCRGFDRRLPRNLGRIDRGVKSRSASLSSV